MRIKIALLLLVLSTCGSAYAQKRVNEQKLVFEAHSKEMTKATGWAYNEEIGEWIENENFISSQPKYLLKGKKNAKFRMSHTHQNFLSIQTKALTYRDTPCYALIIERYDGEYDGIQREEYWIRWKQTYAYLFTKEEYTKLGQIRDSVKLWTNRMVTMDGREKQDEQVFLNKIRSSLSSKVVTTLRNNYLFNVMRTKEGAIRFLLPETEIYTRFRPFKNRYFEAPVKEFYKIILSTDYTKKKK